MEEKTQPPLKKVAGPVVLQGDSQMSVQEKGLREGCLKKLRMLITIWGRGKGVVKC